ncbi:FecCD family ABC transporter permease [Pseudoroseicyclus tamaricis]|uniref:FecCD family ABC transporter permease n=1 Tax=Pseudoroseicyclus tamaricis TaxID=2705421 RepID=UPI001F36F6C5|nr:iron ABC transporter permease [Pseudoroseicyclus tamaricis]
MRSATIGAPPRRRSLEARGLWLIAVLAGLAVLCALSVSIGTRAVGWQEIWAGLGGATDTIGEAAVAKRVPRTLLAALAGAALGLSGAVMQGVTRNPLADPGILGVNMGAALAVVLGIAWFGMVSFTAYIWVAVAGAALTVAFVYAIASVGPGGATPLKLALSGVATSVAFSSFITGVVLPRNDIAGGVRSWQIGGVGGASFAGITEVLPVLFAGFVLSLLSAKRLNSLALGDELAAGLGERVALARATSAAGAVLLCGATTAICGPIGFVGLAVPHLCRLLVGIDHRWLLPFSALVGAGLLIAADVLGRVVARPSEMDVGIITAFLGAPIFIWIVRRQRIRAL